MFDVLENPPAMLLRVADDTGACGERLPNSSARGLLGRRLQMFAWHDALQPLP